VPLSSLYKTEIHKNCFGGGGTDDIGWRLVDVLAQTPDGTLTVEPQAQRRVCASHRCRGSITVFWDAVHDCAASGYWKVVALAFATAKSQCHHLDQDIQESGQWLARIRATFHGIDTSNDAAMLNVERMAELSALEALSSSAGGMHIQPNQLEVKCSSVPTFDGALGQDSVRLSKPTPAPNRTCARVTSRWPAHQEQGVAPDLKYVILHFDRCIQATNETMLELTLTPVQAGQNGTVQIPLKHGLSDLPAESLIFPLDFKLGSNREVQIRLAGHPVLSCKDQDGICDDFSSTFYTVVTDPAVIRTKLVADRWLRSTFDLPVQAAEDSYAKFHVSIEPWSKGSKAARGTAHVILTPSTHMYRLGAKIAVSGSPLNDTCVYSLEPHDKRKMCSDGRTFEADLCAVFECIGERIPCGSKVEVKYPAGMALGIHTEVLSRQGEDETFSRECAAPQLVHSIPLQFTSTNNGLLEFAWSQPVAFAGGKDAKKFSLCHASTLAMTCPLEDVDFDDRHVIPCTGLGGDCAVWSIKLDAPQLPSCGGLLLEIDEGAVVSKDDETPNKPTIGRMTGDTPCPRWDEEKTCFLVDRDRLENEEEGLDWETRSVSKKQLHLQADLDQMHVQYSLISWSKKHLLRRLTAQSYLPRCLILPSIHNVDMENFSQAIFDYVRVGGQLYILGSMENIDLMAEAFNFTIDSAETGNLQVRTIPSPSQALGVSAGLPENLPVLNQVWSISLDSVSSQRNGTSIQANGLYSRGHVEPTLGWFGFGVIEVRAGNGFLEYLGFDWHHGSAEKRLPWAKLLQTLVNINFGRWAPPPATEVTQRRLGEGIASWPSERRLQDCPPRELPPADAKDLTCSISFKCQGSSVTACDPAMNTLTEMTSRQGALFLERMRFHCTDLSLRHFSPAFPVKMAEQCPPWGVIDEMMKEMKAACGFGYGPDASVLDVEVIKSNLGVETFSSDMRAIICEQSFCRGQIARMADLFKKCPGEAGTKGERARLVRMLMGTVKSCTRAGGATVNVQDRFLLKGVNVLNPGEHDGLAAAVEEALANGLPHGWPWWLSLDWPVYLLAWLAGVPFAHTHGTAKSLVSVNVRPHYPKVDVWSRASGVADVTMPAGQGAVAFVPQDLPGGACQGCTVRNLQVLAVHPAIGAEEVDPEGVIRIFFDSVVVVDNPNALIRIYPKVLESVCKDAEANPHVYYPWDTGTGDVEVASHHRHATRLAPGVPVRALCQVHRVSDSLVKVGDEVLQITPRHPLMRNTEIEVQISPWAVRAANLRDEERYPARWTGWIKEKEQTREMFTFKTSSPSNSFAQVSLAMGCSPAACAEAQQLLSQASESLAERMECFISWYRCSGDSTSPRVCDERERPLPDWCDIYAPSWKSMAVAAPALAAQGDATDVMKSEPLELRSSSRRGMPSPPAALWVLSVLAFGTSCFAIYRAADWVRDEFLTSREYDPYLAQKLQHYPSFIVVALFLMPIGIAFNSAFFAPIFYHRALTLGCDHSPQDAGGMHFMQLNAAHQFSRLQSQMAWAGNLGLSMTALTMACLAYATIAVSHKSSLDLGQLAAVFAFLSSFGSVIGGAGNFIAETAPVLHDQMHSREKHFEVAVLAVSATALLTTLLSIFVLVAAAVLVTLAFEGIGDILQHFLHYAWMHWTKWYDPATFKPIGKWYAWILHIRDLQLIHGFQVILDGHLHEDGFVRIDFYVSNDSYNVVSTRSVPVRAFGQKSMHPFEGDNICLNIIDWRSVLWIDVMYQPTTGAHTQRVARAIWDPWARKLLQKCFHNAALCDPHIGTDHGLTSGGKMKLWDFQDLVDTDGTPKEGHYIEQRVNLTPNNGLLSLQMTHLGPKQVLDERDDPSDQPSKELFLGDTYPSLTGVGYMRKGQKQHQVQKTHSGPVIGMVSKVSGYLTLDKRGIGGVELEMVHEIPKRYGTNSGKHQEHDLEASEWIVAVHQQQQEEYPTHFGKALSFFTSAGRVKTLTTPGALSLKHLAAARGHQIRKLIFERSSSPYGLLKSIQTKPVDGKGYASIVWTVDEEVEYVEISFNDEDKEVHGQKSGKHSSTSQKRTCHEHQEYIIGVTQELGTSQLGKSFVLYTSKGKAFRIAGRGAEDRGQHHAVEEGKQVVGMKWSSLKLEGFEVGVAQEWK